MPGDVHLSPHVGEFGGLSIHAVGTVNVDDDRDGSPIAPTCKTCSVPIGEQAKTVSRVRGGAGTIPASTMLLPARIEPTRKGGRIGPNVSPDFFDSQCTLSLRSRPESSMRASGSLLENWDIHRHEA